MGSSVPPSYRVVFGLRVKPTVEVPEALAEQPTQLLQWDERQIGKQVDSTGHSMISDGPTG